MSVGRDDSSLDKNFVNELGLSNTDMFLSN